MDHTRDINIRDLLIIIIRKKWWIIITFLAILGPVLYFLRTQPETYQAYSRLIIESNPMSGVYSRGQRIVYSPGGSPLALARPSAFYYEIIKSRRFAQAVVQQLMPDSTFSEERLNHLSDAYRWRYNLNISEDTGIVELSIRDHDPRVVFDLATAGMEAFRETSKSVEQEEYNNRLEFIDKQLELLQGQLEDLETHLQRFKERTGIVPSSLDEDMGVPHEFMIIQESYLKTKLEREIAEATVKAKKQRLNQIDTQQITIPKNVQQSPEMTAKRKLLEDLENRREFLLQTFSEGDPEIRAIDADIQQVSLEIAQIVVSSEKRTRNTNVDQITAIQNLQKEVVSEEISLEILRNREDYYAKAMTEYKAKHPDMMENTLEYLRLVRSKKFREERYMYLLESGEQGKIEAASHGGSVKVIDPPAFPKAPIPSQKTKKAMIGFLVALFTSFGLAFLIESFDTSLRTSAEISRILKWPVLGIIPSIHQRAHQRSGRKQLQNPSQKDSRGDDRPRLVSNIDPRDPISEAYRSLMTNLRYLSENKQLKKILVSSATPKEGKTLTSANLAISFADMGERVLLVDLDLRCPRLHKVFDISKSSGISELFLREDISLDSVIQSSDRENLFLLMSGRTVPNPAKLISSHRMKELIEQMYEKFDRVIFDTPPIVGVADAALLASEMDGVLLVVKSLSTSREVALHAKDLLVKVNANVLGVILNDVDVSKRYGSYGYHYYNYYHSYYHYYHKSLEESNDESIAADQQLITHRLTQQLPENSIQPDRHLVFFITDHDENPLDQVTVMIDDEPVGNTNAMGWIKLKLNGYSDPKMRISMDKPGYETIRRSLLTPRKSGNYQVRIQMKATHT